MRLLTVLLSLLAVPGIAAGDDVDTRFMPGLGDAHYRHVESRIVGRGFHIYVSLPPGYPDGDARYPAIYLLDGGGLFPLLAAYHRYLRLGEEVEPAIVVGIGYAGEDRDSNFRTTDYTAPSDERESWGGAARFQAFLADELLPRIEKEWRADPGRRVIFGHSLGGQFVLFTAQTRPELFAGHIASNPALHRNLGFFLATRPADPRPARTRVFVGSGENDAERYRTPLREWHAAWTGSGERPWIPEFREFPGHSHMSLPPVAFRDGLRWLAAGEPAAR